MLRVEIFVGDFHLWWLWTNIVFHSYRWLLLLLIVVNGSCWFWAMVLVDGCGWLFFWWLLGIVLFSGCVWLFLQMVVGGCSCWWMGFCCWWLKLIMVLCSFFGNWFWLLRFIVRNTWQYLLLVVAVIDYFGWLL